MTSSSNDFTACRKRLLENGYTPIPVTSPDPKDEKAGKKPAITGWPDLKGVQVEDIDNWTKKYPHAKNTGILCGNVIGIDIDVADPLISSGIKDAAFKMLGADAPIRVGRDPRFLIVCRSDTPFMKKKSSEFFLPSGEKAEMEVLGRGQQFVAYGIHPLTMKPYVWINQSPEDVPFSDLPIVTEEQIKRFLLDADQILLEGGALLSVEVQKNEADGKRVAKHHNGPVDPAIVTEALDHIPNNDVGYDMWLRIGFACHSGLGDAGFDLWDEWSQRSSKYDAAFTLKTWRYFKPGGGVTVGSLFYLAKQHGWRRSNESDDRPEILITGGNLPDIVDQSEEALIASKIEIFQRNGALTRPVREKYLNDKQKISVTHKFVSVPEETLSEFFMRSASYKKQSKDGDKVSVDVPPKVANTYIARQGGWQLPNIAGVIYAPTLRSDGSLINEEGYDFKTGLYAAFDPNEFLPIPDQVSLSDAQSALRVLQSIFATFPFADGKHEADESVVISAILTGLTRQLLPTAPMFGFTAPTAGSGKSMLVDLISIIVYGRIAAVISPGKTEEELEKRLGAAFLHGDAVISLDNCNDTLQGAFLCQVISQERVKVRILGQSKNVELSTNTLLVATGNNLNFGDDMTRRVLQAALNPQVERPEDRQFGNDPLLDARQRRAELIAAALTIIRGFIQAGRPQLAPILGSFPDWSRSIRSMLVWLGRPDPCKSMERVRENDPALQKNIALLFELDAAFLDDPFTTMELVQKGEAREKIGEFSVLKNKGLHSILTEFSGGKRDLNTISIGKALARLVNRNIGGIILTERGKSGGRKHWVVTGGERASQARQNDGIF